MIVRKTNHYTVMMGGNGRNNLDNNTVYNNNQQIMKWQSTLNSCLMLHRDVVINSPTFCALQICVERKHQLRSPFCYLFFFFLDQHSFVIHSWPEKTVCKHIYNTVDASFAGVIIYLFDRIHKPSTYQLGLSIKRVLQCTSGVGACNLNNQQDARYFDHLNANKVHILCVHLLFISK